MALGNDFLSQQIHGMGMGLGFVISLGKGKEPGSQIVLPKKQTGMLQYRDRINDLIQRKAYRSAKQYVAALAVTIPHRDYLNIEKWFYQRTQALDNHELSEMGLGRSEIEQRLAVVKTQISQLP